MKVVKLDKSDIKHLVGLILEYEKDSPEYWADMEKKYGPKQSVQQDYQQDEKTNQSKQGTPEGELSDTKGELLKQVKTNITQMINNEDVGTMVSLFVFLLTDDASEYQMRRIGNRLKDHLEGGGKETDFEKAVTRALKPLTKRFVKSLVDALSKEMVNKKDKGDIWEQILREADNANDDQAHNDLKSSSTKNKLKANAINRVNQMSSNKDVMRVFSMFLLYLTDKDTASDLKALGNTYGEKLNQLLDMNDVEWAKGLIQQLLSKFNPLIETMAEAVDEQLKGIQNQDKVPDKTEQQKNSQFKQDQTKIQDIIKKYNIR